jgi:hypothetical protein
MDRFFGTIAVWLVAATSSLFAAPLDDILHLVPPNTGICLVIRDLRGHSQQILQSPFASWFQKSEFGKKLLASGEITRFRDAQSIITAQLDMLFEELRDDLLGDVVVLAYQPGRGANGDGETGILLLKARKPESLNKFIKNINAAQKQTGELRALEERKHHDLTYFLREKSDGQKEYYFTRDDGVLGFSAQESAIQNSLFLDDRQQKKGDPPKRLFANMPSLLGTESALVQAIFNPRLFDEELLAKAKAAKDPNEQAFLTQFSKIWNATAGISVALTLDTHAELAVNIAFEPNQLPPEFKAFVTPSTGSTSLWSVIPDNALLAVAGRIDLKASFDIVRGFMSDEAQMTSKKLTTETVAPILGRDVVPKLFSSVGPDCAFWVVAPNETSKSTIPTATFAIRIRPEGSKNSEIGKSLVVGLDTIAHLFRLEYNKNHDDQFTISDEKQANESVKVLQNENLLPEGLSVAYGLRDDYLVIASHPKGVVDFRTPKPGSKIENAPLMKLSVKTLTALIQTNQNQLGVLLSKWTGEKANLLSKRLQDFAAFVEMAERIELHHTGDGKKMKLALRIQMVAPLKK